MRYTLRTWLISVAVIVVALVGIRGGQCADVDWETYHQKLTQYMRADKNNVNKFALRTLDRVIVQAFENHQTSQAAWPTLLALARARRTIGYADSWTFLEDLRHYLIQQTTETRFIEALAEEYLAIDLPWTALSLLNAIAPHLSSDGRYLRGRIENIIDMIRADAAHVTPIADSYSQKSDIERRFFDLMGIPPYAWVGSYLNLGLKAPVRRDEYGLGKDIAALATGTSLVGALLQGQPQLDIRSTHNLPETKKLTSLSLNNDQKRAAEQIIRNASSGRWTITVQPFLWRTFVPLIIANFEHILSESSFDWTKWRDRKPLAKRLELVTAAKFSDGAVLQFREPDEELTIFTVISSIDKQQPMIHAIAWRGEGSATWRILDVDGVRGDEIVFVARVGSNHVFSLGVYNPHQSTLTMLARDVINGSAAFLQLDDDPALEIIVSMATSDHRFGDCNQCPVRRLAICYDLSIDRASYVLRNVQRSGTDLSARTVASLFGWGPEFYLGDSELKAAEALNRLRDLSRPHTANRRKEDLHTLFEYADLLIEADYFTTAADVLEEALSTIKSESNDEQIESLRRTMTEMRLHALLNSHAVEKADQVLNETTVREWADSSPDFAEYYYNAKVMTKLMLGDFSGAYQASQAGLVVSDTESASLHGNLAMYFINIGEWRAARRTALVALDFAIRREQEGNVARDMLLMATIAAATNQFEEATDWLARLIRLGNSFASPALSSSALVLAAEMAVEKGFVETAIQLLDAAIANMDEQFWAVIGARAMRIYGDAFRLMGQF